MPQRVISVLYLFHERAKSIEIKVSATKKEVMQTFLFSGNSKSAYMKHQTGKITKPKTQSQFNVFATVVSRLLILHVPFRFPTIRTREGNPQIAGRRHVYHFLADTRKSKLNLRVM